MNPDAIRLLNIETGIILLFLVMMLWTQIARAREPGFYVQEGRLQLRWLTSLFLAMTVIFTGGLGRSSPLLGVELAAGITLSLMHPANAFCFMAHMMIIRPWELLYDNAILMALPRLMVLVCLFSWLIHPKQHPRRSWRDLTPLLFLLGFSIWLFLTTFKTPNIEMAQSFWFDRYFRCITMLGICVLIIESERSARELELTLVISSLALITAGFYQYVTDTVTNGRLKSTGLLGDPNDLSAIIVMAMPFALSPMFTKRSSLPAMASGWVFAALGFYTIWLARSRGALLAVVAEFLAFQYVRSRGRRLLMLLTIVLLGAGYLGLVHCVPRDPEEMAASSGSRITLWKTAVHMALHNPLMGVGFSQFPAQYESYVVGTVYEWGKRTAHSSWFLALGESGLVGLVLFAAFFVAMMRIAWRNRLRRPAQLYSLVGYGVAMSFLSHTYFQYYYLLTGLILSSTCADAEAVRES